MCPHHVYETETGSRDKLLSREQCRVFSYATCSLRCHDAGVVPTSHPPVTFVLGAIRAHPHALACLQTVLVRPFVCVSCTKRQSH